MIEVPIERKRRRSARLASKQIQREQIQEAINKAFGTNFSNFEGDYGFFDVPKIKRRKRSQSTTNKSIDNTINHFDVDITPAQVPIQLLSETQSESQLESQTDFKSQLKLQIELQSQSETQVQVECQTQAESQIPIELQTQTESKIDLQIQEQSQQPELQIQELEQQTELDKCLEDFRCPICWDIINICHVTNPCGHMFCQNCIAEWLKIKQTCPSCQQKVFSTTFIRQINALFTGFAKSKKFSEEINQNIINRSEATSETIQSISIPTPQQQPPNSYMLNHIHHILERLHPNNRAVVIQGEHIEGFAIEENQERENPHFLRAQTNSLLLSRDDILPYPYQRPNGAIYERENIIPPYFINEIEHHANTAISPFPTVHFNYLGEGPLMNDQIRIGPLHQETNYIHNFNPNYYNNRSQSYIQIPIAHNYYPPPHSITQRNRPNSSAAYPPILTRLVAPQFQRPRLQMSEFLGLRREAPRAYFPTSSSVIPTTTSDTITSRPFFTRDQLYMTSPIEPTTTTTSYQHLNHH